MWLLDRITQLDKSFGWSFFGVVVALLFGALTLYTDFLRHHAPQLAFEVLSNTPVLSVHEPLPELAVIYQQNDITRTGQTLSVVLVRMFNKGSADVVITSFDPKVPVALRLTSGALIRADIVSATNSYLREVAAIKISNDVAVIDPVILESGESCTYKLLALHQAESPPGVTALGKIAGMRETPQVSVANAADRESFLHSTFAGSLATQAVRLIGYFVAGIISLLLIDRASGVIYSWLTPRWRRRKVAAFRASRGLATPSPFDYMFTLFVDEGTLALKRLRTFLCSEESTLSDRISRQMRRRTFPLSTEAVQTVDVSGDNLAWNDALDDVFAPNVKALVKNGLFIEAEGAWHVNSEHYSMLRRFSEYVGVPYEAKGE